MKMQYAVACGKSSSNEATIRAAVLRADGSVGYETSEGRHEATLPPKNLRQIAVADTGLWCRNRRGELFRFNIGAAPDGWVCESVVATTIGCDSGGHLVAITKRGKVYSPVPNADLGLPCNWEARTEPEKILKPRRSRVSFGLRSMLVFTALVAFSIVGFNRVRDDQARQRFVARIEEDSYSELETIARKNVWGIEKEVPFSLVLEAEGLDPNWPRLFPTVEWLHLWSHDDELLEQLVHMPRLTDLKLYYDVDDLRPLRRLPNLETLQLESGELAGLEELKQLKDLRIEYFYGQSVANLSEFTNLERLEIVFWSEPVRRLDPRDLSRLKKLRYLFVGRLNGLDTLDWVTEMTDLEELWLTGEGKIDDLSPLANLKKLKTLQLPLGTKFEMALLKELPLLQLENVSVTDDSKWDSADLQDIARDNDRTWFIYRSQSKYDDSTHLWLEHTDAKSLPIDGKDLEEFVDINLATTEISDLSQLVAAKNLTHLDLAHTPVTDISPLRHNKELRWLSLHNTQVSDLSPLADLTNLTTIILSETPVADISTLKKTGIANINLQSTKVSDLEPIREFRKTLRYINLSNTEVTDLSPLEEQTGLETFAANGVRADFEGLLSKLHQLRKVDLGNTAFEDASVLPVDKIEELNLENTKVCDLSNFSGEMFVSLNVKNCAIQDISVVGHTRELYLRNTKIRDLSSVAHDYLEVLDIGGIPVETVDWISDCKYMRAVRLNCDKLVDFSPLAKLENLEEVYLENVGDKHDLTWLEDSRAIRRLRISGGEPLASIEPVFVLQSLKLLRLPRGTQFTTADLAKLPELDRVYVGDELLMER